MLADSVSLPKISISRISDEVGTLEHPDPWCVWLSTLFESESDRYLGEWAFQYLRQQSQIAREAMIAHKVQENLESEKDHPSLAKYTGNLDLPHPSIELDGLPEYEMDAYSSDEEEWHSAASTDSILANMDIIAFRALWGKSSGRLIVYPSGIRFVRSINSTELWILPFMELKEMRKFCGGMKKSDSKLKSMLSRRWLEFIGINGQSYALEIVRDRDEAFNYIIGFSNLQWQILQSELPQAGNE